MRRLTRDDRENLTILALLGGSSGDSDTPQQFLQSVKQLSRHKCIMIWGYNWRKNYFLTEKGWGMVLRFCKPARSAIYQSLKKNHANYMQPTEFGFGKEISYK